MVHQGNRAREEPVVEVIGEPSGVQLETNKEEDGGSLEPRTGGIGGVKTDGQQDAVDVNTLTGDTVRSGGSYISNVQGGEFLKVSETLMGKLHEILKALESREEKKLKAGCGPINVFNVEEGAGEFEENGGGMEGSVDEEERNRIEMGRISVGGGGEERGRGGEVVPVVLYLPWRSGGGGTQMEDNGSVKEQQFSREVSKDTSKELVPEGGADASGGEVGFCLGEGGAVTTSRRKGRGPAKKWTNVEGGNRSSRRLRWLEPIHYGGAGVEGRGRRRGKGRSRVDAVRDLVESEEDQMVNLHDGECCGGIDKETAIGRREEAGFAVEVAKVLDFKADEDKEKCISRLMALEEEEGH